MSSVPRKIGKYEVVLEMGRGDMGTAHSAHDAFSDRLVAIKAAHPRSLDKNDDGQRFREISFDEANAAHPLARLKPI